jgi:glycosyltransferase involved in cell wall biosynthesis
MTHPPQVSVVIPTRGRWNLLSAHALPSALGQIDVEVEVIVVVDGPTDETVEALARMDDPRVRVLRNERTRGPSGARNTGIAAARGEWLAFLDDDDVWSPEKLRSQLDQLRDDRRWVFSSVVVVGEGYRPLYSLPLPEPDEIERSLMKGNVVPGGASNVVASTRLIRELGSFDETLVHSEDWDLWIRLARFGRPNVCQEVHVGILEHSQRSALQGDWWVVRDAERLLARYGPVSRRQLLSVAQWLALEQHRGGYRFRAARLFLRAAVTYRSPGNIPAALGALFGERGIEAASGLLQLLRGTSHLTFERTLDMVPQWIETYRSDPPGPLTQ